MRIAARVGSITRRAGGWAGDGDQFDVQVEGRLDDRSRLGRVQLTLTGLTEEEAAGFRVGGVAEINVAETPDHVGTQRPATAGAPLSV